MNDDNQPVLEFPTFISTLTQLELLDMSNFFEFTGVRQHKTVDLQHLTALTKLDLSSNYLSQVAHRRAPAYCCRCLHEDC